MANVEVTQDEFPQLVIQQSYKTPIFVEFYLTENQDTVYFTSLTRHLEIDVLNDLYYYQMNLDDQPELRKKYGISDMPCCLVFKNGEVIDKINLVTKGWKLAQLVRETIAPQTIKPPFSSTQKKGPTARDAYNQSDFTEYLETIAPQTLKPPHPSSHKRTSASNGAEKQSEFATYASHIIARIFQTFVVITVGGFVARVLLGPVTISEFISWLPFALMLSIVFGLILALIELSTGQNILG